MSWVLKPVSQFSNLVSRVSIYIALQFQFTIKQRSKSNFERAENVVFPCLEFCSCVIHNFAPLKYKTMWSCFQQANYSHFRVNTAKLGFEITRESGSRVSITGVLKQQEVSNSCRSVPIQICESLQQFVLKLFTINFHFR